MGNETIIVEGINLCFDVGTVILTNDDTCEDTIVPVVFSNATHYHIYPTPALAPGMYKLRLPCQGSQGDAV